MELPSPDDDAIIVCHPVADLAEPLPTATITQCLTCRGDVWIAPSSLEILAQAPRARVLCVPCALAEMDDAEDVQIGAAPGAFGAADGLDLTPDELAQLRAAAMRAGQQRFGRRKPR